MTDDATLRPPVGAPVWTPLSAFELGRRALRWCDADPAVFRVYCTPRLEHRLGGRDVVAWSRRQGLPT